MSLAKIYIVGELCQFFLKKYVDLSNYYSYIALVYILQQRTYPKVQ